MIYFQSLLKMEWSFFLNELQSPFHPNMHCAKICNLPFEKDMVLVNFLQPTICLVPTQVKVEGWSIDNIVFYAISAIFRAALNCESLKISGRQFRWRFLTFTVQGWSSISQFISLLLCTWLKALHVIHHAV